MRLVIQRDCKGLKGNYIITEYLESSNSLKMNKVTEAEADILEYEIEVSEL